MNKAALIETCTKICYYAQEHSCDGESWGPRNSPELWNWMQHTSFVVACFIAQNTPHGHEGVEWEVVQKELVGPVLSMEQWEKIITKLVEEYYSADPHNDQQDPGR